MFALKHIWSTTKHLPDAAVRTGGVSSLDSRNKDVCEL